MAKYEVSIPGRGRFEVTGPSGMSDDQVIAAVNSESQTWGEYGKGIARQAAQGLTFSFGDEIEAGARSLLGGGSYSDLVADIRKQNESFAEENPVASFTANVAGGLPLFALGPGGAAASWAARGGSMASNIGRSAALGAGTGAVSGFGAGEGGLGARLQSAGIGAGLGAGIGAAAPPAFGAIGWGLRQAGNAMGVVGRARGGGRPPSDYEPPVPPRGPPVEGASFMADGAPPPGPPPPEAFSAQEGAMRMIGDWITSAGGTIDDVERAVRQAGRSQELHSSGHLINAQTLAELYPPLQRLLRAGASGYREVGEDVTRFLQARQTGILPHGASAADLAQRGIPTRERFLPGRTVQENLDRFGVELGSGRTQGNLSPTGQLGRLVDATKRLFRIRDDAFHGHAATAGRTSDEILAAMKAESAPAYNKAFAAGDMMHVRSTIQPILQRWEAEGATAGKAIRRTILNAVDQFRDKSKNFVARLRDFDQAKQALDDEIEKLLRAGEGHKAGLLVEMKKQLLQAVDDIKDGNLGALYSEARGIYAKGARNRDILENFKASWKDDPEAVIQRYDALESDEQRKLARYGIVWGLESENAGRRAAQDASLSFDVRRAEEMLTQIGRRMRAGEADAAEVMRRFGGYVAGEQEMVRGTARTAIGGSMTDRNLQDALAMGGMEIIQNVQSWANIWRGSTSLFEIGRAITEKIVDRAFGLSADRAREMSRLLLTANPQELAAIIARLRMMMPAKRMDRFNELMRQSMGTPTAGLAGAAGGAVGGAPQPPPGGPTFL